MRPETADEGRRLGLWGLGTLAWPVVIGMLLVAVAGPVRAQQSAYVHGRVVASGGPPLQGAQLQVLPAGPGAETDPDGAFTLGPLAAGTYHVRVRRIGFQPDTVTLKVPRAGEDFVIQLTAAPQTLDPVFSSALEQDLPRVMDRMRQNVGATVFGPELMKHYPGISVDDILATDSTVYPFMRGGSFPHCHPVAYLNGKELPGPMIVTRSASQRPTHLIFPDLDIRRFVRMKDVAVIEVYRFARRFIISEPWIRPDAGTRCHPIILIWTKDFKQRPYKGLSR